MSSEDAWCTLQHGTLEHASADDLALLPGQIHWIEGHLENVELETSRLLSLAFRRNALVDLDLRQPGKKLYPVRALFLPFAHRNTERLDAEAGPSPTGMDRNRSSRMSMHEARSFDFRYRFGGSLNLNTHLHAVVVDGVFEQVGAIDGVERVQFHFLPLGHPAELTAIACAGYRRFTEWLKKNGLMKILGDDDTYEDEDTLAACLRGSLGRCAPSILVLEKAVRASR